MSALYYNVEDWNRGNFKIMISDDKIWKNFEQARKFVHELNLKSHKEWVKFCKSGDKPQNIPYTPDREYKGKGWISWGDWLGTENVAAKNKKYLPFKQARELIRSLNLKNEKEFKAYLKSDNMHSKSFCIPSAPQRVYKKEWNGINDWLGTEISPYTNREFLPFEEAREYVHKLGLKSVGEWDEYYKSGKLPPYIPSTPRRTYENEGWKGFGDWLGTNTVASQNKQYRSFKEAREFASKLGLTSQSEWFKYVRSERLPLDIPIAPNQVYENEWIDWGDWLGTGRKATQQIGWSIQKVKELIKDLIKNKVIDEWSDNERYHLLTAKGILNLRSDNRFSQLLGDLVIGPKTEEQRKALEDFVNSDDDVDIPDIGNCLLSWLKKKKK